MPNQEREPYRIEMSELYGGVLTSEGSKDLVSGRLKKKKKKKLLFRSECIPQRKDPIDEYKMEGSRLRKKPSTKRLLKRKPLEGPGPFASTARQVTGKRKMAVNA